MLKRFIIILLAGALLSSCDCAAPLSITSIQRGDKKLACKDIILEINEAEHYRDQAEQTKGIASTEFLTPSCWVTGYMDANSAVKSANARINYLGHIYDLLDCSGAAQKQAPPPPAPKAPPRIVAPVPAPMGFPPPGSYPQGNVRPFPPNPGMSGTYNPYTTGMPPGSNKNPVPTGEPFTKPMPLTTGSQRPYRRVPIDEAHGDSWLHEHTDRELKVYTHSHPHQGPHRHAEDDPNSPPPFP